MFVQIGDPELIPSFQIWPPSHFSRSYKEEYRKGSPSYWFKVEHKLFKVNLVLRLHHIMVSAQG